MTESKATTTRRVLHVGLPKTATTTLQMHLFATHPQVRYLGKFMRRHDPFCDDGVATVVHALTGEAIMPADADRIFADAIAAGERDPSKRATVLSQETLSIGPRDRRRAGFETLRDLMRPGRVFITLRDPLRLAVSAWVQRLQAENVGLRVRRGRRPRFVTLDDWLGTNWSRPDHGELSCLDYGDTIDDLVDVFGRDAVRVFAFEQLASDADTFVTSLCGFIGIDAGPALRGLGDKKENVSFGAAEVEHLRALCASPLLALRFRMMSRVGRRRMLDALRARERSGGAERTPRIELSQEWKTRLADHVRSANRKVAEGFDLPLGALGYPV